MVRYWGRYIFLLLTVFGLVACGGAAPSTGSTLVEVPSTTPIPPTSLPEPSPIPLPTETATLTPTPQPSPTVTSEPTPTTEPTPTPTPTETPTVEPTPELSYEPWGVWPSQEEITAALQSEQELNTYPLKTETQGSTWKELYGWVTNPRITDLVIADRFEISLACDIYYDSNNPDAKLTIPLYGYDRVEDSWLALIAGSTETGRMSPEMYSEVIEYLFGGKNATLSKRIVSISWQEFENYRPSHYNGGIGQADFVALLHEALGVTKADIDHFIQTGDPSTLPLIDGERWLFPNQISGFYFDKLN